MKSKPKNEPSASSTTTDPWVFVLADSPPWRAWKRIETPDGKRWAFRYRDPGGKGVGCDVPTEWPPGYVPTPEDLGWKPRPYRASPLPLSRYLQEGGRLPGPNQHMGRHEVKDPGLEGRRVMPRHAITDLEQRLHDSFVDHTNTVVLPCGWRCTPRMRQFLNEMATSLALPDSSGRRAE